jgi:hypothetical protein
MASNALRLMGLPRLQIVFIEGPLTLWSIWPSLQTKTV